MAAKTHMDEGTEGAVLNTTEARQGGRPRAMLWVLLISIALAVMPGWCWDWDGFRFPLKPHPLIGTPREQIYDQDLRSRGET